MVEKYRGDTFVFPFSFKDTSLSFEKGDVIRYGAKKACDCNDYAFYKEITIEEESKGIQIIFTPEETKNIIPGEYEMELELTKNDIVETCYRETIKVVGDIVNGNNTK